MERYKKLGYDVFVNVLANLIAAAIVYLVGVLAGLFPRDPVLLTATALVLTVGALAGVLGWVLTTERHQLLGVAALLVLPLAMAGTMALLAFTTNADMELRVMLLGAAAGFIGVTLLMVIRLLRALKEPRGVHATRRP